MYKKIPYQTGRQLLDRFSSSDEAQALIDEDLSINDSIETLLENELYFDLVQLLAHGLPVREAIWWGAHTLDARNDVWSTMQKQCISTAKAWVKSPSEEQRRKSELFSNKLNLNCGPSWLAQSVFWNGSGSIVAPDLPTVLPDPFLYSKAVAGAINHSAALPNWDKTDEYYKKSIGIALELAKGSKA